MEKHWHMRPRPVRPDVETRIISHLKVRHETFGYVFGFFYNLIVTRKHTRCQ